jgi:hypothetical protein
VLELRVDPTGRGVARDVGEHLLKYPEHGDRAAAIEIDRRGCGGEAAPQARLPSKRFGLPLAGSDQAEPVERFGSQLGHYAPHRPHRLLDEMAQQLDPFLELAAGERLRIVEVMIEPRQLELHPRQRLAEFVVQLARQTLTFLFPGALAGFERFWRPAHADCRRPGAQRLLRSRTKNGCSTHGFFMVVSGMRTPASRRVTVECDCATLIAAITSTRASWY